MQPGKDMCAAGYCLYGSSCCLVLSVGDGVSCFTLDPSMVRRPTSTGSNSAKDGQAATDALSKRLIPHSH